jgi:hypothetical protein
MGVYIMKISPEERRRQYRIIYESLYENARITNIDISEKIEMSRITASNRLKDAFEQGYVTRPQIRKRSYANLKQYMFFVDCKDPLESYLQYSEDQNVVYHAVMDGFANLWVTSLDKMIIQGNILVGGPVSDMHVSFAPPHSWDEAKKIMREKVETFDPEQYEPKGIIQTHYDEQIEWDEEDELLYRYFKYDLRKLLHPIARKNHISDQRAWDWLKKLPQCCSIITKYYPQTRAAYDPYIFIFETDYEDFIIELFSEMPSSSLFFRVADTLVLFIQVERELSRKVDSDITDVSQLYIPLLTRSMVKKGIVKSRAHAIVNYHWRKDI